MRVFLLIIAAASLACSTGPDTTPQPDAGGTDASKPTDGSATDVTTTDVVKVVEAGPDATTPTLEQHCIDKINEYRATLSLAPYIRDPSQESCADGEAKTDALAQAPHSAFPSCSEYAQNECPGYPSSDMPGSLDGCLAQMWAEGPGSDFSTHGHYINMTSTSYTHAFCGFYKLGDGTFWAAQDFY